MESVNPMALAEHKQLPQASVALNLKCSSCGLPFANEDVVQFGTYILHLGCFKCSSCAKHLDMQSYDENGILTSETGLPLCSDCGYRCAICNNAITDEAICADEALYHPGCFKCSQCNSELENLTFTRLGDKILCTDCKPVIESLPNVKDLHLEAPSSAPKSNSMPSRPQISSSATSSSQPSGSKAANSDFTTLPCKGISTNENIYGKHSSDFFKKDCLLNFSDSIRVFPKSSAGPGDDVSQSGSSSSLASIHLSPINKKSYPHSGISSNLNRNRTITGTLFSGSGCDSLPSTEDPPEDDDPTLEGEAKLKFANGATQFSQKVLQTAERTITVLKHKLDSEIAIRKQIENVLQQLQLENTALSNKSSRLPAESANELHNHEVKARAEALRLETSFLQNTKTNLLQEIAQLTASKESMLKKQKETKDSANHTLEATSKLHDEAETATLINNEQKMLLSTGHTYKEQVTEYEKDIAELERSRRELESSVNERASYLEELFLEIDSLQEQKARLDAQLEDWEAKCTRLKQDTVLLAFMKHIANQEPTSGCQLETIFDSLRIHVSALPNWQVLVDKFLLSHQGLGTQKGDPPATTCSSTMSLTGKTGAQQTASQLQGFTAGPSDHVTIEPKTKIKAKNLTIFSLKNGSTTSSMPSLAQKDSRLDHQPVQNIGNNGTAVVTSSNALNYHQGFSINLDAIAAKHTEEKTKKSHAFELHIYKKPRECDYCGEKMWGKELKCSGCAYHAHVKCSINVSPKCTAHLFSVSNPINAQPSAAQEHSTKILGRAVKPKSTPVLGVYLNDIVEREVNGSFNFKIDNVPLVVSICIKAIEDRGLEFEGIYRKSGSISQVNKILEKFSTGEYPNLVEDLDGYPDISSVTSTLKKFFMDLADPLFTYQLYPSWMLCASLPVDSAEKVSACKKTIENLPLVNKTTLILLIRHLALVAKHSHVNKMTATNLGVVWGPSLVKSPNPEISFTLADSGSKIGLIEYFINNYETLFTT